MNSDGVLWLIDGTYCPGSRRPWGCSWCALNGLLAWWPGDEVVFCLSFRVEAGVGCSGSVGGRYGGVYAFVGLSSVVVGLSRLEVGVVVDALFLPATTLINYNTA